MNGRPQTAVKALPPGQVLLRGERTRRVYGVLHEKSGIIVVKRGGVEEIVRLPSNPAPQQDGSAP